MFDWLAGAAPRLLAVAAIVVATGASMHILLHKRHARSAVGWLAVVWLSPLLGAALYAVLGINRVHRRAARIAGPGTEGDVADAEVEPAHLQQLAHLVGQVSRYPLRTGNRVALLCDGDEAYPDMLDAIERAQRSISLATYIFDVDAQGQRFIDALARATERGVAVRVLIDGVGAGYSWPRSATRQLRDRGVTTSAFPLSLAAWRPPTLNLRNHRKALVVDGTVGFTGGMNLRGAHVIADDPTFPTRDLAVRVEGPAVADLQQVFVDDWDLAVGERLDGEAWFPPLGAVGDAVARVLPDGPDDDLDVASWTRAGALACAEHSVRIATPYFLPEEQLQTALKTAALRGVRVDLLVPEVNNLPYMVWAAMAEFGPMVDHDVRVWLAPAPFDHSKLMVVDEAWTLIGSANWDARSLRLNFELELETYDAALARAAAAQFDARRDRARRITREELAQRSLAARLRDRTVWLLKPYL